MKTADLTSALLDYWVAQSEGTGQASYFKQDDSWYATLDGVPVYYSRDWESGGPIIERKQITMAHEPSRGGWSAGLVFNYVFAWCGYADAPLVAAMRAYVASIYGDTVPDEVPTVHGQR